MWSAIRWATYNIMCTSMADIKKAGIYKPTDLIKFPWDVKQDGGGGNQPTEEEIEYLRQLMIEENARLKDGEH